jgi:hypothetical protein
MIMTKTRSYKSFETGGSGFFSRDFVVISLHIIRIAGQGVQN